MATGLIFDTLYLEHRPGRGHPECPERCEAALRGISDAVPAESLVRLQPRPATRSELELCHSPEYIETVKRDVAWKLGSLSTGDTDISEMSLDAALLAAGGVIVAVEEVMKGTARNAFCVVRPPGHHATRNLGMGFCIFNNAAIGAAWARKQGLAQRVLIADWDVHHGNGTQDIFYAEPSVFYFSTHQWPQYPGTGAARETGAGAGRGFTMNCPVPAGAGREEIVGAFREKLVPAMREFKPELVMISAGFDGRRGDPIGNLELTDGDFSELTRIVLQIAAEHAKGRLVSTLEGGYDLDGLAASAGAHVSELAAADPRARGMTRTGEPIG